MSGLAPGWRAGARGLVRLATGLALMLLAQTQTAWANDKLTVLLDWFINPDHAPMMVADYIGAFRDEGLDVTFVSPADPSMPPRLIAAGHGDIAVSSQQTLYIYDKQGLGLVRVGTLMSGSLMSLATIETGSIHSVSDLKGRRIGIANISPELSLAALDTLLNTAGLSLKDVKIVSIGDQLVTSLLTHQVDAVPVVRTFESIELHEHGAPTTEFPFENYGVPQNDSFIFVVRKDRVHDPRIKRFLIAVAKGAAYLKAHPQQSYAMFIKAHPDLNNALNHDSWFASLPYFVSDPGALDRARYDTYADYLVRRRVLGARPALDSYAVELP